MAAAPEHSHDEMVDGADARPIPPVIAAGHTFESVTDKISGIVLTKRTPIGWLIGFAIGFGLLMLMNITIGKLLFTGIGIFGNNNPVGCKYTTCWWTASCPRPRIAWLMGPIASYRNPCP